MTAYPPETYDERDDLKAHYIFEEHMHQLEAEEAEKDRIAEEFLLALSDADCIRDDSSDFYEVPVC